MGTREGKLLSGGKLKPLDNTECRESMVYTRSVNATIKAEVSYESCGNHKITRQELGVPQPMSVT